MTISHAFGNVPERRQGDEYRYDPPYKDDDRSIVNVGNQLRTRHFDHLASEFEEMVPDTRVVVTGIR